MLPLRRRWISAPIDGAIYGEPIIADGRIFVATEADEVYALDANSGRLIWRHHLGVAVPAATLPCGDISPTVGVTSTMVLDRATGALFVSAETTANGTVHHLLFALQEASGTTIFRRVLDQPGWQRAAQLQRAALTLANGRIYVGFGGNYGDCGRYHGAIIAVAEGGRGPNLTYQVPAPNEGAIWAPSGMTVNAAGDLYVATGNSPSQGNFNGGEAVIELSPKLRQLGYFAPRNFAALSASDLDLGSTAPMLLPHGRAFIVGKQATAFLLRAARLGGVGASLSSTSVCNARGADAVARSLVYVPCPDATMTAVRVATNAITIAWRAPSGITGSPTVAGGAVWSLSQGVLYGLDLRTGLRRTRVATIDTTTFAAPSAGAGLLVVGGIDRVEAFEGPRGLLP